MEITNIGRSSGIVFHYTKLANITSIIGHEKIIFRAGRYDVMNDPYDSTYAASKINKTFWEQGMEPPIDTNVYDITPYLVSFCTKEDEPLMWRLYDAEVALHIDSRVILKACKKSSHRFYMNKVSYSDDAFTIISKAIDYNKEVMTIVGGDPQVEFEARAKLSFFKHPDFKVEREWRMAFFDDFNMYESSKPASNESDLVSEIMAGRTRYGGIYMYRNIILPRECLKGITIKANKGDWFIIENQIRTWLAHCGFAKDSVKILFSKTTPIR